MSSTILLADDSPTIQKVVELTFADTGHEVITVSSGDELLERLPSVQPDLVICDVIMPGTDGYSVCQTIKSGADTLHIPVILLTGTFEPFDRDRALAAGCDEIITKPFEARHLVETVERLLGTGEGEPAAEKSDHFEGAVAPPLEAPGAAESHEQPAAETPGEAVEAAPPAAPEEHRIMSSEEVAALDFTTTGFAEMEAAGNESGFDTGEIPDEGLDFDLEEVDTEAPFDAPIPERAAGEEPPGAEPDEPFAAEPAAVADQGAEAADAGEETPFEVAPAPAPAEPPVTAAIATPPAAETWEPEEAEGGAEPEPAAPEPEVPAAEEEPAPEPAPAPAEPPEAAAPATGFTLSDEDVDRIARRVVELAADRLERIAWEVIPDTAEMVVRQRIREIEAEIEEQPPD